MRKSRPLLSQVCSGNPSHLALIVYSVDADQNSASGKRVCESETVKRKGLEEMRSVFQLILILAMLSLGAGLIALVVLAVKLLLTLFFVAVIFKSVFR